MKNPTKTPASQSENREKPATTQSHSPLYPFTPRMHTEAMGGSNESHVVQLPHPAVDGATWWQIWECRARMLLGQIANRLGFGGLVQPITMDDPVTGQHIEIRVSSLFTEISVDGRDYYFRRLTGRYDGAGMGCSNRSSWCRPVSTPELDPSPSGPCSALGQSRNE
jgi:hypothetical protein